MKLTSSPPAIDSGATPDITAWARRRRRALPGELRDLCQGHRRGGEVKAAVYHRESSQRQLRRDRIGRRASISGNASIFMMSGVSGSAALLEASPLACLAGDFIDRFARGHVRRHRVGDREKHGQKALVMSCA